MDHSTSSVYVNVPINTPSTTWFSRSAVKLRSTRGVNCELASCREMIVTEKTTPVTVMRLPAITLSTARAACALPPNTTDSGPPRRPTSPKDRRTITTASAA